MHRLYSQDTVRIGRTHDSLDKVGTVRTGYSLDTVRTVKIQVSR
jgi:hypothetical protein